LANPAPIVYPTPLSSIQLDAAATATVGGTSITVAGASVYSPAAGTILNVGKNQTLSVTFTPTSANFRAVTAHATINVDKPPVAAIIELVTTEKKPTSLPVAQVVAGATSGSGGPLIVTAASSHSARRGTVTMSGGRIQYTPPDHFVGLDSFTYTLSDGTGSAEGTVRVTVASQNSPSRNSLSIASSGGSVFLEFSGIPGVDYVIQSAPSPRGPWTDLSDPLTADATGLVTYTDTDPQSPEFYRTRVGP